MKTFFFQVTPILPVERSPPVASLKALTLVRHLQVNCNRSLATDRRNSVQRHTNQLRRKTNV
ncbi:hypothetical protein [Allocoleopsis franciscana]|uniref:hypothetical protein n=1 Tax=Allocoleopsis franciscana TaxID=2886352 RepID=UPI0012DC2C0B|nr:hypothetical protein [Allocoleopsis franciscana]